MINSQSMPALFPHVFTRAPRTVLAFALILLPWSLQAAKDGEDFDTLPRRGAFHPAPPPPTVKLHLVPIATGLDQPIYVTAPPRSSQLFIIERTGRIRVMEKGDVRTEPFLDLSKVVDWMGERGLLGLAFAPDYATTGCFYVAYSEKGSFATVIMRFHANVEITRADTASGEEILRIAQTPDLVDHKAGWIGFRPSEPNYLYIASGDGGGHNDPNNVAQNLLDRRGKLLRVDVSGVGPGFAVPQDNPFVDRAGALPEIWAYGVRNPFRTSFDRDTSDMYFGDVGQDAREELNYEPAGTAGGRNYGWRVFEGRQRNHVDPDAKPENLVPPILDYAHEDMMFARGCIIGGYVYRGTCIPELRGAYFFADFTNARLYSMRYADHAVTDLTDWSAQLNRGDATLAFSGLVSFGEDGGGELYVVDFAGSVFKIVH
jgi:glucose/arabinose dehydrogenase